MLTGANGWWFWGWSAYRSEVIHKELLLNAPEQVRPSSNGEEKMTCHDSLVYTKARKKGVRVNEGGVVAVQRGQTDQSSQRHSQFVSVLTFTSTICGVAGL